MKTERININNIPSIIWGEKSDKIFIAIHGNTKEDAANIGFRDEYIYSFIKNLTNNTSDSSILKLECIDREKTIETFNKFMEKSDKTIY